MISDSSSPFNILSRIMPFEQDLFWERNKVVRKCVFRHWLCHDQYAYQHSLVMTLVALYRHELLCTSGHFKFTYSVRCVFSWRSYFFRTSKYGGQLESRLACKYRWWREFPVVITSNYHPGKHSKFWQSGKYWEIRNFRAVWAKICCNISINLSWQHILLIVYIHAIFHTVR